MEAQEFALIPEVLFAGSCAEALSALAIGSPFVAISFGRIGKRHFPSAFWVQTTSGRRSEISLITKRLEKSEAKRIRSRNVFASRNGVSTAEFVCGMVMPLSLRPPHGVTLIRRTWRGVSRRWLSSC